MEATAELTQLALLPSWMQDVCSGAELVLLPSSAIYICIWGPQTEVPFGLDHVCHNRQVNHIISEIPTQLPPSF